MSFTFQTQHSTCSTGSDPVAVSLFHPEDITPVDLHDHVRGNQHRYFRGGTYSPVEAATLIATEALLAGASDVRITTSAGWIGIYADLDWLADLGEAVFSRMVPFPAGGPNGITAEIFPVIFARAVVTATPAGARAVKGESLGPLIDGSADWARAVAFEVGLA
ncbi:hypothetical protein [Streptomyces sp. ISID311]|uniref:hypothetical protein n=1 Tax=Streptomyces sp. ISID311 TaxID=2601673 RepID=UPI0011BD3A80|nr:hypothetical protein [Streptomyces sp. ISID311]TXC96409.1 hypothetical protein FS847_17790 [Streptomyces sp. ISID311]